LRALHLELFANPSPLYGFLRDCFNE